MTQQHTPTVGDYMTEVPATIETGMPLGDALDRMYSDNIRHLPIVDEHGKLVGVLSTRDAAAAALRGLDPQEARVESVMARAPYSCAAESPLLEVIEHMERGRLGSVVVTRGGKPCGIFTTTDAMRVLRGFLSGGPVEPLVHPTVTGGAEHPEHPTGHPRAHGVRTKAHDSMVSWFLTRL